MKPETQSHLMDTFSRHPQLKCVETDIYNAFNIIRASISAGGKILTCGNGGSAADAEHIVGELMKGFLSKRQLTEAQKKALYDHIPAEKARYLADHLQQTIPALSLTAGLSLPVPSFLTASFFCYMQI